MPKPKVKKPKTAKTAGKTKGGTDDSSGLGFGPLDKLSPGSLMKLDIQDLIKKMNPLSFIIPNFGSEGSGGGLKKTAEDMVMKMLYSFACSACCSCLPFFIIILVVVLATGMITGALSALIESFSNLF